MEQINQMRTSVHKVLGKFAPGCLLHMYLVVNCAFTGQNFTIEQTEYTILSVIKAVKSLITNFKMYDPRNSTVIVFSHYLDKIFGMEALHISQLTGLILEKMYYWPWDMALISRYLDEKKKPTAQVPLHLRTQSMFNPAWADPTIPSSVPFYGVEDGNVDVIRQYRVKDLFLQFLHSCEGIDQAKTRFTFREISGALSRHLVTNKARYFDNRNIAICKVKDTPLGVVFNLDYFHRSQCHALMRGQLIEIEEQIACTLPNMLCLNKTLKPCSTCLLCLAENTIFVHKHESGDFTICFTDSCLSCSKIIFKKKRFCPVCKDIIDDIME